MLSFLLLPLLVLHPVLADSRLSEEAVLRRYSLDQLLAAKTLLRAELTSDDGVCGSVPGGRIPSELKPQLPQLLEALIQEKLHRDPMASATLKDENQVRECALRCRCGAYADALASLSENARLGIVSAPGLKRAYAEAEVRERRLSSAKVFRCATANLWLCRSPLLKHILSQTAQ